MRNFNISTSLISDSDCKKKEMVQGEKIELVIIPRKTRKQQQKSLPLSSTPRGQKESPLRDSNSSPFPY